MYDEDFSDEKVYNEQTQSETSATSQEPYERSESKAVIYCGPNKPKLGLKKYSMYIGGLPPAVTDAIAQIPEIIKLIVPYTELEALRKKIRTKGTPEFEYYARIEAVI